MAEIPLSCIWDGDVQAAFLGAHGQTGTCCHTCTCQLLPSPGTSQSAVRMGAVLVLTMMLALISNF